MGYTTWSSDAYNTLKTDYSFKSTDDIFISNRTKTIFPEMNPKGLGVRESRDSDEHPNSLAIMVFLDVTGSMKRIPEVIVRKKLNSLMETLITHNVKDAAVMFSCIGDHLQDKASLQVGQFESGTQELNKWLISSYLEGGGGGQDRESYLLSWLVAGRHTSIDCFEKRGQKGFLFTIGDERSWSSLSHTHLEELMGYTQGEELTDDQLLIEAQRMYNVFHIHIQEGSYRDDPQVINYWKDKLGQRLILLDDYNKISEVIASTVAVSLGESLDTVVNSFDSSTALIVRKSIENVVNVVNGKEGDKIINL